MEKINIVFNLTKMKFEEDVSNEGLYYRASDVDALREAVRRLVEAAKVAKDNLSFYDSNAADRLYLNLKKAIAAVEALEVKD